MDIKNSSSGDLSNCIKVIPVRFLIDEKIKDIGTTRIYMIDKNSSNNISESKTDPGNTLDMTFMTEENLLKNIPSKTKQKSKRDFACSVC